MLAQHNPRNVSGTAVDPLPGLVEIDLDVQDATPVLRVRGDVDTGSAERLGSALVAALDAVGERGELVVDLRDLAFIDCRGVRVLIRAARVATARGVRLRMLSGPVLDQVVGMLGGWAEIADPDPGLSLVPAPGAEHGAEHSHSLPPAEYAHLMPLFVERSRLPADHPRQRELRAELITGYLPVARNIARRHRNRGENMDDLEQVAAIGLIKAVDRFQVDRANDFLAFAIPTINGEVQRHYRDRTSTIRMPRRVRGLQSTVLRAVDDLRRRDGSAARPSEIARHLGLEPAEVIEALEAGYRGQCASLDEPWPGHELDGENPRFAGALAVTDPEVGLVVDRESLGPLLAALPDRERRILLLRFFGNRTQSQIAAELAISQMHVSRLLSATLARLRADLGRVGGTD